MKTGIVFPGAEGRQRHVGTFDAHVELANTIDIGRFRYGHIDAGAIRKVTMERVLVDTGANLPGLPSPVVRMLGLRPLREVDCKTDSGVRAVSVYGDVTLSINGRSAPFECVESVGSEAVTLGIPPLQALGLELDLQNQRLILLPDRGPETYVMAL